MGFSLTNAELDLMLQYSEGNTAVLFLLIAIRCTEQGPLGCEMGIMDKRSNTLEKQVQWARNTILSKEKQYKGGTARHPITGLFVDEFLVYFSGKYAPADGTATNDPRGLNVNHLRLLRFFHSRCRYMLGEVA